MDIVCFAVFQTRKGTDDVSAPIVSSLDFLTFGRQKWQKS